MKSLKKARKVTGAFHQIHRQLENCTSSHGNKVHETRRSVKETCGAQLRRELEDLGGRQAYQEASVLSTTRHRTCKWVFAMITKLGLRPGKQAAPLRLLEVGAVNTQLISVPWLSVRAIDVQAQHPKIEQVDFFDLEPASTYDVVVLSMFLNCVASPCKRGRMLALVKRHLKPGGHFFLMIPRRCVENSPYCTSNYLEKLLLAVGLEVLKLKHSPKVVFVCAMRIPASLETRRVYSRISSVDGVSYCFTAPPTVLAEVSGLSSSQMTDDFAVCCSEEDFS